MTLENFSSDYLDTGVAVRPARPRPGFLRSKRVLDLTFALLLLPVLGVISALLLLLDPFFNRGPVFYSQPRVGRDEERFRILKFRTMEGTVDGSRFATEEQGRIRPLGCFLRATRIDELPQILNVLAGHMSMVGPRPEQEEFYEYYKKTIPGYARRQSIRPGITGLAQLKYGYTSDEAGTVRKLKWDLEYIRRAGYRLELYVVWETVIFVFARLLNNRTRTRL